MHTLIKKAFGKTLQIEADEIKAVLVSFLLVFTLMAGYYILRPVRDAMASDWSDAELSWLWTANFFISGLAVIAYGFAVAKIRFSYLVPAVYGFFAASFLLFYLSTQVLASTVHIDKIFYVWVSFFAMFHVSVFWSFMAEIFSREQAKRLFGFIAAGASSGAVAGPAIPVLFAEVLGVYPLLLLAALLLLFIIPLIIFLEKTSAFPERGGRPKPGGQNAIGGDFYRGFVDFFSSPYLLAIGLFILLYTALSTFVYYELKNLLVAFDRAERARYWGMIDLSVNTLAIFTAMFATGRLALKFGLAPTLGLIPCLLVLGWLMVAITPALALLIGLQIVRRAGNYAITRPGREMLFTLVSREVRFKAKPVIDVVVYRGGDMLTGWAYTALAHGLGLGLTAIAGIGAGLALLWTVVAVSLGLFYERARPDASTMPGASAAS